MPYIVHYSIEQLGNEACRINADFFVSADRRQVQIVRPVKKDTRTLRLTKTFYAAGTYSENWGTGYTYTQV